MRIITLSVVITISARLLTGGCSVPVFTQQANLSAAHNPLGIAAGDFNNDGTLDYAVASTFDSDVVVYLGQGDGTFATGGEYPTGGSNAQKPIAADFNNDGFLDLAVLDYSSTDFAVLLNSGSGTFLTAVRTENISAIPTAISAADFNDDGNLDIVVTGFPMMVFYGAGDGTFPVSATPSMVGANTDAAAGADLNDDGMADLIVVSHAFGSTDRSLSVAFSTGTGFGAVVSLPNIASSGDNAIDVGDLDGDGWRDVVVVTPAEHNAIVFRNEGSGSLVQKDVVTLYGSPVGVVITDINRDATADLVFACKNANAAEMATGNGDGSFAAPAAFAISATKYMLQMYGVAVGDTDSDGIADILLADALNDTVFRLKNLCGMTQVDLASYPNPSTYGSTVTFDAHLSTLRPGPARCNNGSIPTGTVTFSDGSTVLGTASLIAQEYLGDYVCAAQFTFAFLSVGSHTITATYSGDTFYAPAAGSTTQTVNSRPFGVPLAVTATGDPVANTILVRWAGSDGVSSYEVSRLSGGTWTVIATPAVESYLDTAVDQTQAYFYRVRAFNADPTPSSPYSASDVATTFAITTNPAAGAFLKASDVYSLRTVANYTRAAAGLPAFTFTDPNLTSVVAKAIHVLEIRTAVGEAMTVAGMPGSAYSSIFPGAQIRATDFTQLIDSMR